MPAIYLGDTAITNVHLGATPLSAIYLGSTPVWNRAGLMYAPFDIIGALIGWIRELFGYTWFSDGLVYIVTEANDIVGTIVSFVQGTGQFLGSLVNHGAQSVEEAICGGIAAVGAGIQTLNGAVNNLEQGIIGFINGLPVVAGQILQVLQNLPAEITSLIGTMPVVGSVGQAVGLVPDAHGVLGDAKNYVTDLSGNVIGYLSCGKYTSVADVSQQIGFVIGGIGNSARMLIPDGLVNLDTQTGQVRFDGGTSAANDGFVEAQVAAGGDPGYITQLFRRYSNDGSGDNGVGMRLVDSTVSLVRRAGGPDTDAVVSDTVPFIPGDVLRVDQAGDVHTLIRNGETTVSFDDTGHTAAMSADNLSIGMTMQGAKEMLGPRLFSPALSYMLAS